MIDDAIQCWGCPIFDKLFQIISQAGASIYPFFSRFCLPLLAILLFVYFVNAWMQNAKNQMADPFFKKSLMRVGLNVLIVGALLGSGLALPRFISNVILEPVTEITTIYTSGLAQLDLTQVEEKRSYSPEKIKDDGFYSVKLRDKILKLMETTVTQFQGYIKLGFAITENAFSWRALLGLGAFLQHFVLFILGITLSWGFAKLFFRYCCKFADAIVAMAFFAFFLPLSLIVMVFSGAEHVPAWIAKLGEGVGIKQLKTLVNAIITLGSVVLTYTIIIVVIAKFFSGSDTSVEDIMVAITTGEIYANDLDMENVYAMTVGSATMLLYVLNYMYEQIPTITKMILDSFGVKEESKYADQAADNLETMTKGAINSLIVNPIKAIKGKDAKTDGASDAAKPGDKGGK